MSVKRGIAVSVATVWLAVWASVPFAAAHVLTHHQSLHDESLADAAHAIGFDHARGHDHGEDHSHPTLSLTAGASPRPPLVRDAMAPAALVLPVVAIFRAEGRVAARHDRHPPDPDLSFLSNVLRN